MLSSNRNTHWCHRCVVPIHPRSRDPSSCPHCNTGFIQDLTDAQYMNINTFFQSNFPSAPPASNISALLRQTGTTSNALPHDITPYLIFQGQLPHDHPFLFASSSGIHIHRPNASDFFVGPGLDDLIEQLAQNGSQRGPSPASRASIESMPTVKISEKHIRGGDSNCAVCMEAFELGCRVRKMPCKHLYHSDCILPWLQQRNSCPVCRFEMGAKRSKKRFSFLWPFRSSSSSSNRM